MYVVLWILETIKQRCKQNLNCVFCEPFAGLNSSQWQNGTSELLHLGASGNMPRTLKSIAQNWNLSNFTRYLQIFFLFGKEYRRASDTISIRNVSCIGVEKYILIWNGVRVFDSSELQHWIMALVLTSSILDTFNCRDCMCVLGYLKFWSQTKPKQFAGEFFIDHCSNLFKAEQKFLFHTKILVEI